MNADLPKANLDCKFKQSIIAYLVYGLRAEGSNDVKNSETFQLFVSFTSVLGNPTVNIAGIVLE
jgi:hypothetical protein